jgi:predicted ATP-dependent endonuclease of OLD family
MSTKNTDMRLQNLKLHNFKGIRDFSFSPNGESATIHGANESGKTTLNDALTYVLFGKDSQNRQDSSFGIKTRGSDGKELSGLEHTVEGEFSNMKLKKIYKENYTKKRGEAFSKLTGHTTDYFVDDVPKTKSEYNEVVSSIPYSFTGITHWIIECNHSEGILANSSVPEFLKERILKSHLSFENLKDFLLDEDTSECESIHLVHLSDSNSNEKEFIEEIQKITGVPVYTD